MPSMNPSQDLDLENLFSPEAQPAERISQAFGLTSLFPIERFCFPEQLAFIQDPRRFKTAVCSRRSGKTVACAAHLIHEAVTKPKRICLYITLSRLNAKRIIWSELLGINRQYALGGEPNETELSMSFPNGSIIFLSGAKDQSEIEKFRGLALSVVYIDECQSFRSYIKALIDDVLSKALFDYNGTLNLIGTPGPVPSGYFYECSQSDQWSHHGWSMFQNPHLQAKSGRSPKDLIQEDIERMGVSLEHPKIQRECFGRWVKDDETLVFHYDSAINGYHNLPPYPKWETVIGVDIGFHDSDAIAVLGWNEHHKELFLLEEIITAKQGVTELANQLTKLVDKYDPMQMVMDTGGLGKKIAEELQRRFSLPVIAAEKQRKYEYIELLNDALRTKRFKARPESQFVHDCNSLEWNLDKKEPDKLVISDRYHSDICDAVLYAFRSALHWLSEPAKTYPALGSPEHNQQQVDQMEKWAIDFVNGKQATEEVDMWADMN